MLPKVQTQLGPGLLESVYEEIIFYELVQKGLDVERQKPIPVIWKGVKMDHGFRVDIIVDHKVLIEIKSVEKTAPVHQNKHSHI